MTRLGGTMVIMNIVGTINELVIIHAPTSADEKRRALNSETATVRPAFQCVMICRNTRKITTIHERHAFIFN
jgi:hypothetical protein